MFMEKNFPTFSVEGVTLPRVILGNNPFGGFSHFSEARSKENLKRFGQRDDVDDVKAIADLIIKSVHMGVNAIGPLVVIEKFIKAIDVAQKETGEQLRVIGVPFYTYLNNRTQFTPEMIQPDIDLLQTIGAQFCFVWGQMADDLLHWNNRTIVGMEELLDIIRDAGMIPGIGCHDPHVITVADEKGYDAPCYYAPINKIGYYMDFGESGSTLSIVKNAMKPVIAMKPLASGRIPPKEALEYIFSVPGVEGISIGIASEEEMEEDYTIAKRILART
jgi:hypothetical protein